MHYFKKGKITGLKNTFKTETKSIWNPLQVAQSKAKTLLFFSMIYVCNQLGVDEIPV